MAASRRKDLFIAVAVDIIRFQSYGLQDNVALLVLLHRKGKPLATCCYLDKQDPGLIPHRRKLLLVMWAIQQGKAKAYLLFVGGKHGDCSARHDSHSHLTCFGLLLAQGSHWVRFKHVAKVDKCSLLSLSLTTTETTKCLVAVCFCARQWAAVPSCQKRHLLARLKCVICALIFSHFSHRAVGSHMAADTVSKAMSLEASCVLPLLHPPNAWVLHNSICVGAVQLPSQMVKIQPARAWWRYA